MESLINSDIRYRRLFEAAQDGILILDAETGLIEDVNPYLIKMLGYSHEEFVKKKLWEVGAFKDVEDSQDAFEALQKNETICYEDLPLKAKDGRLIQVEFVSNVYMVNDQKVIQCNICDNTRRKKAEQALRESEERFHGALESMLEGCQIIGFDWTYLFVNKSAVSQSKLNKEEMLGHTMMECFPGIENTEMFAVMRRCMHERTSQKLTTEFVFPDGSIGWFDLSILPSPQGIFMLSNEITQRKLADETLRKSEKRFRALVEHSLEEISLVDSDGTLTYESPTSRRPLGYPPNSFVGHNLFDLFHPDDRAAAVQLLEQVVKKPGSVKEALFRLRHQDGSYRLMEGFLTNLLDEPAVQSVVINYRDVTERKMAEQEIANLAKFPSENTNPVLRLSRDGIVMYANAASGALLGMWRCVVGDTAPQFWRDLASHSLASKENKTIEFECDGVVYEMIVSPVAEPGYVNLYGSDITDRKQAEEALQASTLILKEVINTIPARVFWKDKNLVYLGCNVEFARDAGFTDPKDIIGKDDYQLSWRDQAELYRDNDRMVMESGSARILIEEPQTTPDGHIITLLTSKVPLRSSKGEDIGVLGTYMDITERKQREKEIQSRTDELATLYRLSRALADANDLESVLDLVNRHAVESIHTTFACIALLEDGELVSRSVYPIRDLDHDFNIDTRTPISALPYCQRVLDKNEPVILQTDSLEVDSSERATLLLDCVQSVCVIPLRASDASQNSNMALGILMLGEARNRSREPFTPEKVHLARSIGDQAASAIRRLLHREQAGRRLKHLASLSEIDRTIASNFDLRLSLKTVLQHVVEQLEVDAADVLVFKPNLQDLEFAAGRGFRSKVIEGRRLRLGEGRAGHAALERRSIQIPDCAASGTVFVHPELLEEEHVAAYFAVPLISKGLIKGVLEIYHRTPLNPNKEWLDFLNTLAGQAAIAIDVVQLFDSLQRSNTDLVMAYDATIKGWSRALDMRDKETEGHTQRVTEEMMTLGRAFGLSEADLLQISWGALLHDIGKMGVPDGILLKPGPLTEEEWVVMKKHPGLAFELLSPIRYLRVALDIPYCHHEKWDGTGYPRGLKGEQIPITARIFAIVDVWDALLSDRPYRAAWPEEKVLDYIRSMAGTHFDPQVLKICLESGLTRVHPIR